MQVSLQALKVFEAAARHGSFKLAAEELALTPTAVSHHINNLEQRLNCQLFVRRPRQIALTEAGSRLAQATTSGFQTINSAIAELSASSRRIKVNTTSSLAGLVLLPALGQFKAEFPDIDVEVSTGEALQSDGFALAIRLGDSKVVDKDAIIKHETFNLFSVQPLAKSSLNQVDTVIYTSKWKNPNLPSIPFANWCHANQLSTTNFSLIEFDQELFAIQQAQREQGLVFCSTTLAQGLVDQGLLYPVNTQTTPSDLCYYLPAPSRQLGSAHHFFCKWLNLLLNCR